MPILGVKMTLYVHTEPLRKDSWFEIIHQFSVRFDAQFFFIRMFEFSIFEMVRFEITLTSCIWKFAGSFSTAVAVAALLLLRIQLKQKQKQIVYGRMPYYSKLAFAFTNWFYLFFPCLNYCKTRQTNNIFYGYRHCFPWLLRVHVVFSRFCPILNKYFLIFRF